jgi:hypothetical protein
MALLRQMVGVASTVALHTHSAEPAQAKCKDQHPFRHIMMQLQQRGRLQCPSMLWTGRSRSTAAVSGLG